MELVANKLDLEPNREVEVEVLFTHFRGSKPTILTALYCFCFHLNELKLLQEGKQFAHESEMFYIETSTKTGDKRTSMSFSMK
ncbi:hypothetical protein AHAS_Ahas08G0019300 [Arachis hypogaea]